MLINNYMIIELRIIRVPVCKLLRSFRKKIEKRKNFTRRSLENSLLRLKFHPI